MGKRGPKPKQIDWAMFDKLCMFHCTREEICNWFEVTDKTLSARCMEEYGLKFSALFRQKRSKGKVSLRRSQMQNALGGNTAMQIFLGKNYLDQSDNKQEKEDVSLSEALKALAENLPR